MSAAVPWRVRVALAIAFLGTGGLVFNMTALPLCKDPVFLERGTVRAGCETAILAGFILVLVFDLATIAWVSWRIRMTQDGWIVHGGILACGVLGLVLLVADKALVDEIGREYAAGSDVAGEWIVLYVFLTTQLVANVILFFEAFFERTRPPGRPAAGIE